MIVGSVFGRVQKRSGKSNEWTEQTETLDLVFGISTLALFNTI